jgi:hypothetical protein
VNSWGTLSPKADKAADHDNHRMKIHFPVRLLSLSLALLLSACSPEQNWRDVALEGSGLKVQLPCKPDRTTRSVTLGDVPVDLQVVGCESGSAIVAVMSAALPAAADANAVMLYWQQATLANAKVQPDATMSQQIWHRPGQVPLAASVRIQAPAQRANGEAVSMDAAWGAVAEGERIRLVHAVVYDSKPPTELANTLLQAIQP